MVYECPNCKTECCNNRFAEIVHAEIGIAYVAQCLDRGYKRQDLIDKLLKDVKRLSHAVKSCR